MYMVFEEIIGGIAILASLYYIGIIISRSIILSARRQEVEMAERQVNIKREQLRLLEAEVHQHELISDGDEENNDEARQIQKEKLEVIIGEKIEPKNRW